MKLIGRDLHTSSCYICFFYQKFISYKDTDFDKSPWYFFEFMTTFPKYSKNLYNRIYTLNYQDQTPGRRYLSEGELLEPGQVVAGVGNSSSAGHITVIIL